MLHPLEQKLAALRRRRRRLAVIQGCSGTVVVLLAVTAAFGTLDALMQFEDRGLRLLASLAALGAVAWTARRILSSTVFARPSDAELLRRGERAFPPLKDRLRSAIEFLHRADDDPTAGSPALRRALVARITAEARPIEFAGVLDGRRAARAALLLLAACIAAGATVFAAPDVSRIAVARLWNPRSNMEWPQAGQAAMRRPVDPPEIESLAVRLIPPDYTGLPPSDSQRQIRAWIGTRVRFVGRASRPLRGRPGPTTGRAR